MNAAGGEASPDAAAEAEPPTPANRTSQRAASLNAVALPLLGALALIVIAALGTATALRPRAGYASTLHLLGALALGASAGLLALLALMALLALLRRASRRPLPLLRVLVVAAVAAGLLLAASVQALHTSAARPAASRQPAAAAVFARWQQLVVPIIVAYSSVLRSDASLLRALPRTRQQTVAARRRVKAGQQTLRRLHAPPAPALPTTAAEASPAWLTRVLDQALTRAQQGQATLAAALAAMAAASPTHPTGRSLVAKAKREMRNSQQAMAAFTLEANALGGQLNAQP